MIEASAKSVDMYIASVRDRLMSTLQEVQAQSTAKACQQRQYYDRKIGTVNLKPGDLVLVKADAWKGKRKIKDRWEEETWEVVHQIMADIPSYEVMKPTWMVMSPPPKLNSSWLWMFLLFFMLYHRLVFPCVWAAIIHGTGVPAPPHARLPLLEVMKRGHHKRKLVRQSPDDLPVKLPWGGKMGSCGLYHGCLLECPLRMGEDHR